MNSSDLSVLAAVADAGGITAAARRLNCVQSNVTARLQALERELGVRLFHRHGRGVRPTRAGEVLLPYARRVAALLSEARTAVQDLTDSPTPRGPLAIGSMETTAAVRLPTLLAAYHAAYPAVELSLATGTRASLVADVAACRLDGAFVAGPISHPEVVEELVGDEAMALTAAASVDVRAILSRPGATVTALVFRQGCYYRALLEAMLRDVGVARVRSLEFGTLEGILGGVAAGIGVSLLPRAAAAGSQVRDALRLHAVPPAYGVIPTVFVRRRDALVTAAMARLLETARATWQGGEATPVTSGIDTTVTGVSGAARSERDAVAVPDWKGATG